MDNIAQSDCQADMVSMPGNGAPGWELVPSWVFTQGGDEGREPARVEDIECFLRSTPRPRSGARRAKSQRVGRRPRLIVPARAEPNSGIPRIVVLTEDELSSIVAEVSERVARSVLDAHNGSGEWLGRDEVANLLGYKPDYISELVRRRGLPCHRVGRLMRFRRVEVNEWAITQGKRS